VINVKLVLVVNLNYKSLNVIQKIIYGENSVYPSEVSGDFQLESQSFKIGSLPLKAFMSFYRLPLI
jgi:hypothetical protein